MYKYSSFVICKWKEMMNHLLVLNYIRLSSHENPNAFLRQLIAQIVRF